MPTAFHLDGTGADPDALYYNRSSGTAVLTSGLDEGDEYALDVVVPDQPTEDEVAELAPGSVVLPEPEIVPDPLRQKAAEMVADATTPGEQALALESALTLGYFSDGLEGQTPSRAGHGADRLAALLAADQMVGDDEQYAAAMALMARQLGLPSRVVMGFVPERSSPGPVTVTGADVAAWVEIAFDGAGWVTFDPTPDEDRVPQQQSPKPRSTPQPQVQQPPPPPEEPPQPPPESADDLDDEDAPEDDAGLDVPWALVAAIGLPLLALLGPVLLVLWLKARRRRRRFSFGTPSQRIAGGWAEVVDAVRDLGGTPPARATRRETATALAGVDSAVALAERADAGVFGPGEPTEDEVAGYWADVRTALAGAGAAVGPWRRLRGRLSPRSLRRHH
jgi:transglutaminase-like putative cysteine protease